MAALEPHFLQRLQNELGLTSATREQLQRVLRTRTSRERKAWALQHHLPIAAAREVAAARKDQP